MLLVALSLNNGFHLPFDRSKKWSEISRKTAQVGIKSLIEHGLLERESEWVEAPLSDIGFRELVRYTLRPPFGPRQSAAAANAAAPRDASPRQRRAKG